MCERALVPLEVAHCLAHLSAPGYGAREAHSTAAKGWGQGGRCSLFLRGKRAESTNRALGADERRTHERFRLRVFFNLDIGGPDVVVVIVRKGFRGRGGKRCRRV